MSFIINILIINLVFLHRDELQCIASFNSYYYACLKIKVMKKHLRIMHACDKNNMKQSYKMNVTIQQFFIIKRYMTMISSFITTFNIKKKIKNFNAVLKTYESRQILMLMISEIFFLIFKKTQKISWLNRTKYLKHLLSLNTFKLSVVI